MFWIMLINVGDLAEFRSSLDMCGDQIGKYIFPIFHQNSCLSTHVSRFGTEKQSWRSFLPDETVIDSPLIVFLRDGRG